MFILSSTASSHKFQLNSHILSRSLCIPWRNIISIQIYSQSPPNKKKNFLLALEFLLLIPIGIYSNMYCYCHIHNSFLYAFWLFGISITSRKYEPRNNGNDFLLHLVFCSLCDVLDFIVSYCGCYRIWRAYDFCYKRVSKGKSCIVLFRTDCLSVSLIRHILFFVAILTICVHIEIAIVSLQIRSNESLCSVNDWYGISVNHMKIRSLYS